MRRTCLLLLVLPAGFATATAADNPFSKPASPATRTLIARLPETEDPVANPAPTLSPSPAPVSLNSPVRELPDTEIQPVSQQSTAKQTETPPTVVETTRPNLSDSPDDPQDQFDYDSPLGKSGERNPLFGPSIYGNNRLARIVEERIAIPPLITPTTATAEIGSKVLPEDIGGGALVTSKPLPESLDRYEDWSITSYFWQAPNTFSHPLYFDDPMLERHGHERFPALTPITSGMRFFATIPMLPYLATVREPCDCVYTLGHFRPGSCAPTLLKRPPYERRAAVVQALSTAGAFIAFP